MSRRLLVLAAFAACASLVAGGPTATIYSGASSCSGTSRVVALDGCVQSNTTLGSSTSTGFVQYTCNAAGTSVATVGYTDSACTSADGHTGSFAVDNCFREGAGPYAEYSCGSTGGGDSSSGGTGPSTPTALTVGWSGTAYTDAACSSQVPEDATTSGTSGVCHDDSNGGAALVTCYSDSTFIGQIYTGTTCSGTSYPVSGISGTTCVPIAGLGYVKVTCSAATASVSSLLLVALAFVASKMQF